VYKRYIGVCINNSSYTEELTKGQLYELEWWETTAPGMSGVLFKSDDGKTSGSGIYRFRLLKELKRGM
jgi:hypothetical protein